MKKDFLFQISKVAMVATTEAYEKEFVWYPGVGRAGGQYSCTYIESNTVMPRSQALQLQVPFREVEGDWRPSGIEWCGSTIKGFKFTPNV